MSTKRSEVGVQEELVRGRRLLVFNLAELLLSDLTIQWSLAHPAMENEPVIICTGESEEDTLIKRIDGSFGLWRRARNCCFFLPFSYQGSAFFEEVYGCYFNPHEVRFYFQIGTHIFRLGSGVPYEPDEGNHKINSYQLNSDSPLLIDCIPLGENYYHDAVTLFGLGGSVTEYLAEPVSALDELAFTQRISAALGGTITRKSIVIALPMESSLAEFALNVVISNLPVGQPLTVMAVMAGWIWHLEHILDSYDPTLTEEGLQELMSREE